MKAFSEMPPGRYYCETVFPETHNTEPIKERYRNLGFAAMKGGEEDGRPFIKFAKRWSEFQKDIGRKLKWL